MREADPLEDVVDLTEVFPQPGDPPEPDLVVDDVTGIIDGGGTDGDPTDDDGGVIALTTTLDFLNISGSPVVHGDGVIELSSKALGPHLVLGTGSEGKIGARALTVADLPSFPVVNVTDLQDILDSKVDKTQHVNTISPLSGGNTLSGDVTISVSVGTVPGTVAAGNDSRFPTNIDGIRKGRLNLSDVAAVAKTDYWDTTPFVGSGTNHSVGLVPDPGDNSGVTRFLREDGGWHIPAGGPGGGASIANTLLVIKGDNAGNGIEAILGTDYWDDTVFGASGVPHSKGLVPDPGAIAGTTAFLCENSTWVDIVTFVASGVGHTGGLVPDPGTSAGTTAFLREDSTWQDITVFGPSGVSHGTGLVPDPGASSGVTKFLREDGAWVVPAGGVGGASIAITTLVIKGDGLGNGVAAIPRTDFWDGTVFSEGGGHSKGLVPDPGVVTGTTRFLREDGGWVVPSVGTVTSVALEAPSADYNVTGSPITTSGILSITEKTQSANRFKAGPVGGGATVPTYRSIQRADLPIGTTNITVAAGDDARFSATVVGLRKGNGQGIADVSAVAKQDYWDTTVFGPAGDTHSRGLVPDPGAFPGSNRFLREDGTWQASIYATTLSGDVTGSGGASIVTAISSGAVTFSKLADLAVINSKIGFRAITADKIATGAITANEIGDSVVTGTKIALGTITAANILDATITGSKLTDGAVVSGNIGVNAVTSTKILNGSVLPTKLGYTVTTIPAANIDWSADNVFTKTMVGNTTLTFSNAVSGQEIKVRVLGAYTPAFPSDVQWEGGLMPARVGTTNIYKFIMIGTVIYGWSLSNLF